MEKFSSYVITLEESPDSQSNYRNSNNSVRTCTWADGEKYVGEYKNDKQHGTGTYFRADGKMRTGIWVNHKCIETLSFQSLQKTLH